MDKLIHEKVSADFPLYRHLKEAGFDTINIQWLFDPGESMPAILYNLKGKLKREAFVYILQLRHSQPEFGIYDNARFNISAQKGSRNYEIIVDGDPISPIPAKSALAVVSSPINGSFLSLVTQDVVALVPIQPYSIEDVGALFLFPRHA